MTLSEAQYGREVQIKSINPKLLEKIQSMGFYPGGWLKIEAVGLLGGPLLVQCFHYRSGDKFLDAKVMVARGIANLIEVEEH